MKKTTNKSKKKVLKKRKIKIIPYTRKKGDENKTFSWL